MSTKLQEQKMKEINRLLSQNLSYIYGEQESGPNGAKKEFLRKSADFLRKLGKDLGFCQTKVVTNKAGIACSGSVTLYGMWKDGNGISFQITQDVTDFSGLLYRKIKNPTDYRGTCNQWASLSLFESGDYQQLCDLFLRLCIKEEKTNAA